jgi:hypothetical protein
MKNRAEKQIKRLDTRMMQKYMRLLEIITRKKNLTKNRSIKVYNQPRTSDSGQINEE